MVSHINCRHTLDAGAFIMALAAKLPLIRFRRAHNPWCRFMLFRCGVAYGALEQGMIRRHLGPFNMGMTGSAGTGDIGRYGIMRIMTGNAGPHGIVRVRIYLRETCRPRRIVGMTVGTIVSLSW